MADPVVLLSEAEVAARVAALAAEIAPRIDDDTVAVCLLTGGLWFASDLTRALSRLGRHVRFDALWLFRLFTGASALERPTAMRSALSFSASRSTSTSISRPTLACNRCSLIRSWWAMNRAWRSSRNSAGTASGNSLALAPSTGE